MVPIALLLALIFAASARAIAPSHPYLPSLSHEGGFRDPCGAAVDSQGDVYVAAYYEQKVRVFAPGGSLLSEFSAEEPCGLAVDSFGDVYVTTWGTKVVKYQPKGGEFPPTASTEYEVDTAAGTAGTISEAEVTSVAVDPADDDVYLVEEGTHVSSYDPAGTPIETDIGGSVAPGHSYYGVDVYGTTGDVYVTDKANDKAYVLDPSGTQILTTIDGSDSPAGAFSGWEYPYLAVDQSNGHVLVADIGDHGVVDEFDSAGGFVSQIGPSFGTGLVLEESFPSDIAVDNGPSSPNQGTVYVTSGEEEGSSVYAFGALTYTTQYPLAVKKAGDGGGTVTSSPAGIDCGGACEAEYEGGETIELTATPAANSKFSGWALTGNSATTCVGSNTPCSVTLEADTTITASFTQYRFPLTVRRLGDGNGSVSSADGGISCGSECEAEYEEGETVELEAEPAAGSELTGWNVAGASSGTCRAAASPCTVTIGARTTVTASFARTTRALNVGLVGSGAVECKVGIGGYGPCSPRYAQGEVVSLRAVPGLHHVFAGWSGFIGSRPTAAPCAGAGPECEVNLAVDLSGQATFLPITESLTIGKIGSGAGAVASTVPGIDCGPRCTAHFEEGSRIELVARPAAGSQFVGWSGGGCSGSGACAATLQAPTTVTAQFRSTRTGGAVSNRFRLMSIRSPRDGRTATLKLNAPGPGSFTATGKFLRKATVATQQAGGVVLRLTLSAAGRRTLRRAKHHRLKVRVKITFSPEGGSPSIQTYPVTFQARTTRKKRKQHHRTHTVRVPPGGQG